jgi:hypothetical protein
MTVTAVHKDPKALTMTVEAEFEASPERLWQLWADPRQLERWWGPPAYPATVTAHDLARGGGVDYHMTGPAGDQPHGHWEILAVEPPHHPGGRGCRSRAPFRASRRWSTCSAGAPWRVRPRPSVRSTRSWPRTRC